MTPRRPKSKQEVTVLSPDEVEARIAAAMRALPLSPALDGDIPQLATEYIYRRLDQLAEENSPLPLKVKIESDLSNVNELSSALLEALSNKTVIESINSYRVMVSERASETPSIADLRIYLEWLKTAASFALIPDNAKYYKGPDRFFAIREIADSAARDFFMLTGRPPKESMNKGGFANFLREIFEALNIESRAEDHAKEAVRRWKSNEANLQKGLGE